MSDDSKDECQMAFEAAMSKSAEYCGDQESRLNVLGDILGIEGEEVDPEEALDAGPQGSITDTREWVLARAEQKMDRGASPVDAVNEAWSEANEKIDDAEEEEEKEAEQGPDPEPDDDEDGDEADAEDDGGEEDDLDDAIEDLEEDDPLEVDEGEEAEVEA